VMWGTMDWGWGVLMMVSFWALLALVLWAIVRTPVRRDDHDRDSKALDVLAERFARGEIDDDEYERRRHTLQRTG